MSNVVSRFIYSNNTLPNNDNYNQYFLIADNYQSSAHISFDTLTLSTCLSVFVDGQWLHVELTKDQITHFLSLDCPDAFIAYALTLCPCPPETAKPALVAVDGGILARHELLKESVPVCECGSTFYRDDLGSCYDCFFPSDDRGE